MKNILLLLSFLMSIFTMHSQNIQQLEAKPSFKGITIGMPISEISNKLSFEKSSNGYSIYKVTDAYYYSIFNVTMNYVRVIGLNGKVHAIEVIKMVKATNEHATVFDASELDVIQAGLTRLYGDPQYKLTENNSQYNRIGVQWISNSKEANCFIDFMELLSDINYSSLYVNIVRIFSIKHTFYSSGTRMFSCPAFLPYV